MNRFIYFSDFSLSLNGIVSTDSNRSTILCCQVEEREENVTPVNWEKNGIAMANDVVHDCLWSYTSRVLPYMIKRSTVVIYELRNTTRDMQD